MTRNRSRGCRLLAHDVDWDLTSDRPPLKVSCRGSRFVPRPVGYEGQRGWRSALTTRAVDPLQELPRRSG